MELTSKDTPGALLFLLLFSGIMGPFCNKTYQQDDEASPEAKPGRFQDNILYYEDFEGNNLINNLSVSRQASTSYAIQITDTLAYSGKKAARFELRDTDPENNNGTRAEKQVRHYL